MSGETVCPLPLLTIRADWESVFNTVGEEIWISAKTRTEPSIHGTIKRIESKVRGVSDPENFETTEAFKIERIIGNSILIVNYKNTKILFLAPHQTLGQIHDKEIVALDTTKNKNSAVSACDAILKQWDTKTNGILLEYKGHVSDVNKVYYFPSGVVIVSCALDMQIKIICGETGANPRTLLGHTRSVTDISIVSKGKNIISVSKDCRALLWNVAESKIVAELIKTNFPIICCDLTASQMSLPELNDNNRLEFETKDKVLLLGCENGDVYIVAVQSRTLLNHMQLESDVKAVKFIDQNQFLVGLSNGKILKFQLTCTAKDYEVKETGSWHYTDSCVQCILPCTQYGFFTGHHDGHCIFQFYDSPLHQIHLTGPLFDPIFDMCYDGVHVYTACRDGKVRKYLFENLLIEKTFLNK